MISSSPEETLAFGRELGAKVPIGSIICLQGDLGAGKTTLMRGLVEGATKLPGDIVTSPTFPLLHIYYDRIYHFDLYRIKGEDDFVALGFDEYLGEDNICCIEWSERIPAHTQGAIVIRLKLLSEEKRLIELDGFA
jgi:tRNA threonylcarbamoyladenosine biosynthesis protein TsaE